VTEVDVARLRYARIQERRRRFDQQADVVDRPRRPAAPRAPDVAPAPPMPWDLWARGGNVLALTDGFLTAADEEWEATHYLNPAYGNPSQQIPKWIPRR
jgi:hypothetical protein